MTAEDRFLDFISDCCEKNLDLPIVGQTEKYKQLKKDYEDEKKLKPLCLLSSELASGARK